MGGGSLTRFDILFNFHNDNSISQIKNNGTLASYLICESTEIS